MCQLLGMNCNTPTDITVSFEGFRRRAGICDQHTDGFGIAFFEGKGVRIFRDNRPGASSPMADLVSQYKIKYARFCNFGGNLYYCIKNFFI